MSKISSILCAAALSAFGTSCLLAEEMTPIPVSQAMPIERTLLQRVAVPGTALQSVLVLANFAPNVSTGRHTHPGTASGYVIYGSIELLIDGEVPRRGRVGETFVVPADTVHDERTSAAGARVVATMAIPDGQPLPLAAD